VTLGEQLMANVYNCVRNGPSWQQTLLIITYDEHGGCFDHVAPPPAQPPDTSVTAPFNFDRFGVRVPAVIVSPYIKAGTVLRPPGAVPFDHTSILATLRKCFPALGAPLTLREAAAPNVGDALSLPQPTNMGPDHLDALPFVVTPGQVAKAQLAPLNGMQSALVKLAAHLPDTPPAADFTSFVQNHVQKLSAQDTQLMTPAGHDTSTAAAASAFITSKVAPFLASSTANVAAKTSPIIEIPNSPVRTAD
jgi:phospholipase C